MSRPLIAVLLGLWLYMAYQAFQRGNVKYAATLVIVGLALAAWRLGRTRSA